MNCTQFHDLMFEYLDGSLGPRQKADMDAHVTTCASCRVAYETERTFAFQMHEALEKEAEKVYVSPHVNFVRAKHECRALLEKRSERKVWLKTRLFPGLGILAASVIGGVVLALIMPMYTNTSSSPPDVAVVVTQSPQQVVHKKIEVKPQTPVAVPAAEPTVHGVVVGENGKPLAGVAVWAEPAGSLDYRRRTTNFNLAADAIVGTLTATDSTGCFAVAMTMLPERFVVRAFAEDRLPVFSSELRSQDMVSARIRLVVPEASGRIIGSLKDLTGNAVTNMGAWYGAGALGMRTFPVVADADGSYASCQLPDGSYVLACAAPGYRRSGFMSRTIRGGGSSVLDVQLALATPVVITGSVCDVTSTQGIADVTITCVSSTNAGADGTWDAASGPDGSFHMSLGPESLVFKFSHPEYAPVCRTFNEHDVSGGVVSMSRGGNVHVCVYNSERQPLSNYWVKLNCTYPEALANVYAAITDDEGVAVFTNVPSHLAQLAAEVFDAQSRCVARKQKVTLVPGETTHMTIVLSDARLVVHSASGINPNTLAFVASGASNWYRTEDFRAAGNAWILENIPAGMYQVLIRIGDIRDMTTNLYVAGNGDTMLVISNVDESVAGVIQGFVRDAQGRLFPVEVTVTAWQHDSMRIRHAVEGLQPRDARVKNGAFRLERLVDNTLYDVVCSLAGMTDVVVESVQPGGAPVEFIMPPVFRVTGRVVHSDGAPIQARVAIAAVTEDGPAVNGEGPDFELFPVTPGVHTVRIETSDHPLLEREVRVEGANVDMGEIMVVDDGITLTGKLVGEDGSPLRKYPVNVYGPPLIQGRGRRFDDSYRATTADDGTFTVEHSPRNKRLTLFANERHIHRPIGPFSSDTDLGTVELYKLPMVEVTVRSADGQPAVGVYLLNSGQPLDNAGRGICRREFFDVDAEMIGLSRTQRPPSTNDAYIVSVPMTDAPTNHVTITLPAGF